MAAQPRILLLTSQYFLMGEIRAALERMDVPHALLDLGAKEMDLDGFLELMDRTLDEFRPDLVLTVNHLGVDREGYLAQVLARRGLPLVSWFVDNPELILPLYDNLHGARTIVFTWDADSLDGLHEYGFADVFHLPLGADPVRFVADGRHPAEWEARVSFVGNSMLEKTVKRLEVARPAPELLTRAVEVSTAFAASGERSVRRFLAARYPELLPAFEGLEHPGRKVAFETFVTWQATLHYRLSCVLETLPWGPLIVGDAGWLQLLSGVGGWRHHRELRYYDDLPDFYPLSAINFNCTSQQMKGAVNQRVFDVPCAGAFLLTDHRRQMEDLFEPGREIVCYHSRGEIPDLIARYLAAPAERAAVTERARARILAEHTYDHRMAALLAAVRETLT